MNLIESKRLERPTAEAGALDPPPPHAENKEHLELAGHSLSTHFDEPAWVIQLATPRYDGADDNRTAWPAVQAA